MTSTMTKQEYSVYYGIEELKRLHTAHSIAFDTETLQLQPKKVSSDYCSWDVILHEPS